MNDNLGSNVRQSFRYGKMATEVGKILAESNSEATMREVYAVMKLRTYEAMYREMILQMLAGSPVSFRSVYLMSHWDLIIPYLCRIRKLSSNRPD